MIKVLSLCDGIACGMMAFEAYQCRVEYHAVEIDPFCRELADDNYKTTRWNNDLTLISEQDIINNGPYDWVMFGSPCQSVSPAGNRKGLKGKSGLLGDCVNILKWAQKQNPKLRYIIENVKMSNAFLKEFNQIIGHEPILINSSNYVAQNRDRNYWINFDHDLKKDDSHTVWGTLGIEVYGWSKSGRYKDKTTGKVHSSPGGNREYYAEMRFNNGSLANTLNTGEGCRNQSTCNFVFKQMRNPPKSQLETWTPVLDKGMDFAILCAETFECDMDYIYYRLLKPHECAALQGFPKTFDLKHTQNSHRQLWKAIGNGWSVPVITDLIKSGQKSLELLEHPLLDQIR